ncbi:hypothetical protein HMPREF1860_01552 [Prevotella amnii]|uniref:Uncharacterized protein n=1 Tax=Prevotella amnii TaxID=419005 RepID=A0A134B9J6_9BACT|nr:hypothetical protein HMPREF1860_01552 [Prevotella amnii]
MILFFYTNPNFQSMHGGGRNSQNALKRLQSGYTFSRQNKNVAKSTYRVHKEYA